MNFPHREVWAVDFEFGIEAGGLPQPICLVALELKTGRRIELWQDQFGSSPPYDTGPNSLFIAYNATAEIGCHLALGWPVPERIVDLYVEFLGQTSKLQRVHGNGLLGALAYYGLDGIGTSDKSSMRDLALRGGPWTDDEKVALLRYCGTDVEALERLLQRMPPIDLPRAQLRGRYMASVACMERTGIPMDVEMLEKFRSGWDTIKLGLIDEIDKDYGVYDGTTFKHDRFAAWLVNEGIPWPKLPSGKLDLKDDTFRQQAKAHPRVAALRELRSSISDLRLSSLTVGPDGRNRTSLFPFVSKTSRNQPSNAKFVFGPSVWIRGLIKPPEGYGIAYVDWSQQEFGIAASLSGDRAMQEAYVSGDPYLRFAIQAKAVPADATKASHGAKREQFKACVLAVQYGMSAEALAERIGQPPIVGRELLRMFRETYSAYRKWSEAVVAQATLAGELRTVFGWRILAEADFNPRTFQNFPMQANGAEMLRLACSMATEAGIEVCAPVHDAVLMMAPLASLEAQVAKMQAYMAEASSIVLAGFELRTDAQIVRWPDRYQDPRGKRMWEVVTRLADATKMGG